MNQRQLRAEINNGNIKNFYIFCSDDYFIKSLYIKRLSEACNCEIERIDIEDENELQKIKLHASASRLFSKAKKLIHVRFYGKLNSFEPADNFYNIIVLDPTECEKKDCNNIVMFDNPTREEIDGFINYKLKQEKKVIDPKAKSEIIQAFENRRTSELNMFLDKLILYLGKERVATLNHILSTIDYIPQTSIFRLVDCIKLYDRECFFKVVDDVLNSMDHTYFLNVLSGEIIKILSVGYVKGESLKAINVNQKNLWRYKGYLKSLKKEKILSLIDILYDMDILLKSVSGLGFPEAFKARMFQWFVQK